MSRLIAIFVFAICTSTAAGQTPSAHGPVPVVQAAEKVSVCALQADPGAYNHKMIDVRAVASHGFEDFTLSDPRCERPLGIWLEYGGLVNSETVYCCGVKATTPRAVPLVVEGIATRLIDDTPFRRFDAQVRSPGDVSFRAHLIGRFFAGLKQHTPNGDFWGGYGHLGCCSLLVIQQVLAVEAKAPPSGRGRNDGAATSGTNQRERHASGHLRGDRRDFENGPPPRPAAYEQRS